MRPLAFIIAMLACSPLVADPERYHVFSDPHLAGGRSIWMENCEGCHGWGIADAPVPMHPDDWRTRTEKPRTLLYRHAIDGFFGPDDSMMPARGGNSELTDSEVRSAVDYMVELATHHIDLNHANQQSD